LCCGATAAKSNPSAHVRFTPGSDRTADIAGGPGPAKSGNRELVWASESGRSIHTAREFE